MQATVERLDLADAVTVLGNVPAERLPDVYRAADVVVSLASSDSSPRSVWEALACARPVIVSDLPWARDELANGQALLVPLEAAAVADAIDRVLGDDALSAPRSARPGASWPQPSSTRLRAARGSTRSTARFWRPA